MKNVTNLNAFEYQKKIDAAVAAEIAKGRDPKDFDDAFLLALSESVYEQLSPAARKKSAIDGLTVVAQQVCGSFVAEKMWEAGFGWDATEAEIMACGRRARISDDDILASLAAFKDLLPSLRMADAKEFRALERFLPLFVPHPADTTLGDIAVKKAARGDKLALSFLAWKEVA